MAERYSSLTTFHVRRKFDPSKKEDLRELKFFIENDKWRNNCPFLIEYPWEEIPAMCMEKYAAYMLAKIK